ncbi:hypothetical protein [Chryseobacterium kwangjuense]|uniref:Uncharacterized protein n=1 Tax=Chryseobacterium kwangjuense TaxID=267125 RepID=A0A135WHM6_9FLAO|nr:hypothetical protein [Chryseobacterium kwangjuense]KXH84403.1 hypothetical protein AU378_01185 [Chryseobacterium kwangjuense]
MRKIILGLFLTVVISGFSSANNVAEKLIEIPDSISDNKETIQNVSEFDVSFFSCAYKYITRSYNCDGTYNTIAGPTLTNEPCGDNEEGSIVFVITRVDGCPQGGPIDPDDSIY